MTARSAPRPPAPPAIEAVAVRPEAPGAWTLEVRTGGSLADGSAKAGTFRILGPDGGPSGLRIVHVATEDGGTRFDLAVRAEPGAMSAGPGALYRLLILPTTADAPPGGGTPFRLSPAGETDLDPARAPDSAAPAAPPQAIDYMAKDYASFRRTMLDSLSLDQPGWTERDPADLLVMLVEALAYAGDALSYAQDAVATEAYLGTARQRASLDRHARLLDYRPDDGCNARVWVAFTVDDAEVPLAAGTPLLADAGTRPARVDPGAFHREVAAGLVRDAVFETVAPAVLRQSLNELRFHAPGGRPGTVAAGALTATVEGAQPDLAEGAVLIFTGPAGNGRQAPPAHAVRLSAPPRLTRDPWTGADVTEIAWPPEDAPPFDIPLGGGWRILGNVVLADEGMTGLPEDLPPVPATGTWRPRLHATGVVRAVPPETPLPGAPAASLARQDPRRALPEVRLTDGRGQVWTARRDLLSSTPFARDFVVETDALGRAALRFGDGLQGRRPDPGAVFRVTARTAPPPATLATGAIGTAVTGDGRILAVTNPLPGGAGSAGDSLDTIRRDAPEQLRLPERCITATDFAGAARRLPGVRDATARIGFGTSWQQATVWVQETGGTGGAALRTGMRRHLDRLRPLGVALDVRPPAFVPLDIALEIGVAAGAARPRVEQALRAAFSNRIGADGAPGFFYPDAMRFGATIYLSDIVARASSVPGVVWVAPLRFRRFDAASGGALAPGGAIALHPEEIARVDNDAATPGRGRILFSLTGGHP